MLTAGDFSCSIEMGLRRLKDTRVPKQWDARGLRNAHEIIHMPGCDNWIQKLIFLMISL